MTNEMNTDQHLTTVYLLKDQNGKFHVAQYRPTENFRHHRPSANDIVALMCGCFMNEPSHKYWLNEVIDCHVNVMAAWGIHTYEQKMTVIAKKQFVWDYSKPIGQRMVDAKETKNFLELHKQIHGTNVK